MEIYVIDASKELNPLKVKSSFHTKAIVREHCATRISNVIKNSLLAYNKVVKREKGKKHLMSLSVWVA